MLNTEDEGELTAMVVGALEYGNERVELLLEPEGIDWQPVSTLLVLCGKLPRVNSAELEVAVGKASGRSLVSELKGVGLTDTDASRAAFCALAYHAGWNSARIGRYLGISRARVGQRIDRLHHYTETRDMPQLAHLLETATPTRAVLGPDLPVAFPASNWDDPSFASGMIRQLAT